MISKKRNQIFIYLFILFISVFYLCTRLFRLSIIPFGYHYDEAGMAYDAYCLANYGVDRYLNSYPLYLQNYGGGQSVLYAYFCALLIKIFGEVNVWIIRFPAIFFSFLTLLFSFLFVKKADKESIAAYILPISFIISPAIITCGRFGLDCYLLMGTLTVFSYLLLRAVQTQSDYIFVLSGIAGGITLYSYALSYFILPIILFIFILIAIYLKKIKLSHVIEMGIPLFIFALPLIAIQIINIFDLPELVVGKITLTKLTVYRVSEFKPFSFERLINLVSILVKGDNLQFVNPTGFSSFYYYTIPFFAIGLLSSINNNIKSLKKKEFNGSIIILIWFFTVFILFCHLKPISYRLNSLYLPICYFIAYGVETLHQLVSRISKKISLIVPAGFLLISIFAFVCFAKYYYFGGYPVDSHDMGYFDIDITEGLTRIINDPTLSSKTTQMAEPVVYCYLGIGADPYEYGIINYQRSDNDFFTCHSLTDIDKNQNYIVRDLFPEFSQELRDNGFTEEIYNCYSLFYYHE